MIENDVKVTRTANFPSDDYSWSTWSIIELRVAFSLASLSLSLCFPCRPLISEPIRPSIPSAFALFLPLLLVAGTYTLLFTRSSTYNLYSNKSSSYWKWEGGISAISRDCALGFIGWSRRMIHPLTPIPLSLFPPAFMCESFYFFLFLPFSMVDLLSNIWSIILRYQVTSLNSPSLFTHAYSQNFIWLIYNQSGNLYREKFMIMVLILEWKF